MDHDSKMFCIQCVRGADGLACTGRAGACGKTAAAANAQDELTGAVIGLARAACSNPITEDTDRILLEGLYLTAAYASFDADEARRMTERVRAEKDRIAPGCRTCTARCGNTDDYDLARLWNAEPDIRSVKALILFVLRRMTARAYPAIPFDTKTMDTFYKALFVLAEDWSMEMFLPVMLELGAENFLPGPELPAFVSPNARTFLFANCGPRPVTA